MKDKIDIGRLPEHIAIIMDGNGRWAKRNLLNRIRGHQEGVKSIRSVVTAARELGIKALSLYAFSKENWNRPKEEVSSLMGLLKDYLVKEIPRMKKNSIEIRVLGCKEDFTDEINDLFALAHEETYKDAQMILNLCLSYSGRFDILQGIKNILRENENKRIDPDGIDEKFFSNYLYTKGLTDPDLLIRTSGEMRISNFFLWQIAYSEIYVTDKLWPEFREDDFYKAIIEYQLRERRFGLTSEQVR